MRIWVEVAVMAYLLGSIPFGYLLVRIFHGADIRATGSGNIGATNVARTGAKGLAIATLLLDAAKGFAAVVICNLMWHPWTDARGLEQVAARGDNVALYVYLPSGIAALLAIAGHMFPVWLKFRGGKGVATAVGAFLALTPLSVALSLAVFAVLVAAFRYVSLGSVAAAAAFPVAFYLLHQQGAQRERLALLPAMVAASLLIIFRHRDNLRRLFAGTENKLGAKPPAAMEKQA